MSGCILIGRIFQSVCRKHYERGPVRIQKVEEIGRYTTVISGILMTQQFFATVSDSMH